jgi:hypothetical protein
MKRFNDHFRGIALDKCGEPLEIKIILFDMTGILNHSIVDIISSFLLPKETVTFDHEVNTLRINHWDITINIHTFTIITTRMDIDDRIIDRILKKISDNVNAIKCKTFIKCYKHGESVDINKINQYCIKGAEHLNKFPINAYDAIIKGKELEYDANVIIVDP